MLTTDCGAAGPQFGARSATTDCNRLHDEGPSRGRRRARKYPHWSRVPDLDEGPLPVGVAMWVQILVKLDGSLTTSDLRYLLSDGSLKVMDGSLGLLVELGQRRIRGTRPAGWPSWSGPGRPWAPALTLYARSASGLASGRVVSGRL